MVGRHADTDIYFHLSSCPKFIVDIDVVHKGAPLHSCTSPLFVRLHTIHQPGLLTVHSITHSSSTHELHITYPQTDSFSSWPWYSHLNVKVRGNQRKKYVQFMVEIAMTLCPEYVSQLYRNISTPPLTESRFTFSFFVSSCSSYLHT